VLALKSDGTVWAWGDNEYGQIGNGALTDQTTPVQVSGLSGIVKIATGRFFSLAVKSDGTVWTWGQNIYGQLGNGSTTDSSVPVQVGGLSGVTAAACGAFECHIIKNDGTTWAWGRNTYGNLGDGTVTDSSVPVQSVGLSNVAGVAAGTNFALFYKADGTFYGCGRNASGQLGDGTVTQRNTPTQSTIMCAVQLAGLNKISNSQGMSAIVYPNPSATGKFSLEVSAEMQHITVQVYNITGALVSETELNNLQQNAPQTIDLSAQADGIYYLCINSGSQKVYQKLVKQ